jgi:hypothetical protein
MTDRDNHQPKPLNDEARVKAWLADYAAGGVDYRDECKKLANELGFDEWFWDRLKDAEKQRAEWEAGQTVVKLAPKNSGEAMRAGFRAREAAKKAAAEDQTLTAMVLGMKTRAVPPFYPGVLPGAEEEKTEQAKAEEPKAKAKPDADDDDVGDDARTEDRADPGAGPVERTVLITLPDYGSGDEMVAQLNKKHAFVRYGGKPMVLSWDIWELNPDVVIPTFMGKDHFRQIYMNRYVGSRGKDLMPAGDYWLAEPRRRQFAGVVYRPGRNAPQVLWGNRLNLWQGFAVQPREGKWPRLRDHMWSVLANKDDKAFEYIMRWAAWTFQHPGERARAAIVFRSGQGTGKTILAEGMHWVFGPHAFSTADPQLITGNFTGHLHYCSFLAVEEAFWAGDKKAQGKFHNMITDQMIAIHPKYMNPFTVENCLHVMIISNADWAIPADHDARRYSVLDVSEHRKGDRRYFEALHREMFKEGGLEAMLAEMLDMDLGRWHPSQILLNEALLGQKRQSLQGLDAWIDALLQGGMLPGADPLYPDRCLTEKLVKMAREHDRNTNATRVPDKLKKLGLVKPKGDGGGWNNQKQRGWTFLPLGECRRKWEQRFGGRWPWENDLVHWQVPEDEPFGG